MTEIKFGTDGWRDLIDEGFNLTNVRGLTQAICDYLKTTGTKDEGRKTKNKQISSTFDLRSSIFPKIVVGYDTRTLSKDAAKAVAEVACGNDIQVFLTENPTPTPAVSLANINRKAKGAIIITASHNPPKYNGLKFKPDHGGSASKEITDEIERLCNENLLVKKTPLTTSFKKAQEGKGLLIIDPKKEYCSALLNFVDIDIIRETHLKIAVDPMYGAAQGYLSEILQELGCEVAEIHNRFDPTFQGLNPEPILVNLRELQQKVVKESFDLGLALDGDADRVGAIDERGNFVNSHQIFALLLRGLIGKGMNGKVVKSVSTTQMINILAQKYRLPLAEVPVGFKHICDEILAGDVLIGGEESGGIAIRGHLPERDGILSALCIVELMALKQKTLSQLLKDLEAEVGLFYYERLDMEIDRGLKEGLSDYLKKFNPSTIAGEKVTNVSHLDGNKFYFEDGWLLFRVSGTEPLFRVYAEAKSKKKVASLIDEGRNVFLKARSPEFL